MSEIPTVEFPCIRGEQVNAKRVQQRRTRGWRMPENTVSVARPHRYGNPFIIGTPENGGNITREVAVAEFRSALIDGRLQFDRREVMENLAGKNLACFCPLDLPCHADVLLEIANPTTTLNGTP